MRDRYPRILFVGPGRCGKDTAGLYLERITPLTFAGTTSNYLCKYVAVKLGITEEEAYARRHEDRMLWYEEGNRIRKNDPLKLVNESLQVGEIVGGIRDIREIEACYYQRPVDLIVWIQNDRVPKDPTMTFGSEWADLIIPNNGSIEDFEGRLDRFARFAGLYS